MIVVDVANDQFDKAKLALNSLSLLFDYVVVAIILMSLTATFVNAGAAGWAHIEGIKFIYWNNET